jgi:hypothetical protein
MFMWIKLNTYTKTYTPEQFSAYLFLASQFAVPSYDTVINSMASNGTINEELERIWKEIFMA